MYSTYIAASDGAGDSAEHHLLPVLPSTHRLQVRQPDTAPHLPRGQPCTQAIILNDYHCGKQLSTYIRLLLYHNIVLLYQITIIL